MQIRSESMYSLGASYDGAGVNFALYSQITQEAELCLFDKHDVETCIRITERNSYVWHNYIPSLHPSQRYGYHVYGPHDLVHGFRCNPNKLLLDLYAKAIEDNIDGDESLSSYWFKGPDDNSAMNGLDSVARIMKLVAINPYFDWGSDQHSRILYYDSMIHEAHVHGMTNLSMDVPPDTRGTYADLAYPSVTEYLKKLGITTIKLMPIHQLVDDSFLQEKGLLNYWGYNTTDFLVPHNAYPSSGERGEQVNESESMVEVYHRAGMKVILNVVYNHIAEGNHMDPTLSFKGIDNVSYYRLMEGDQQHYFDIIGAGSSLFMRSLHAPRLITDSLRYQVTEMHVDGFRFDLATTLARQFQEVGRLSTLSDIVEQGPIISCAKLITESWDLGFGGYQVGGSLSSWSEWNGRYRGIARGFWCSQPSTLPELASRPMGSSGLYQVNGRQPVASVNLITVHDGLTMNDLASYNEKHNEANGEDNRDGESNNRPWNCGVEGLTNTPDINDLRQCQMRNTFATLLLSQGIPMICGGDEMVRTQQGNNNAYCQDNGISRTSWHLDKGRKELPVFVPKLIHLRLDHSALHRRRFSTGREPGDDSNMIPQVEWFDHTGSIMDMGDWQNTHVFFVMICLNGSDIPEVGWYGNRMVDNDFILIFNAYCELIMFTLPDEQYGRKWQLVVDTHNPDGSELSYEAGFMITAQLCSFLMFMNDKKPKKPTDLQPDRI